MTSPMHIRCKKCGVTNSIPMDKLKHRARCGKCGEHLNMEQLIVPVPVDEASFHNWVLEAPVPVLVDFWASWCAPCRAIAPSLEKLAEEFSGRLRVAKVDTDDNRKLAEKYNIQAIPTLILFEKGKIKEQFTGAMPISQLRVWIARSMGWM